MSRKEQDIMVVQLIGTMPVDFSNANGERICGTNLFVAFKDNAVSGMRTDKFYVKHDIALPEQMKPGEMLEVAFNNKGKVEYVDKA